MDYMGRVFVGSETLYLWGLGPGVSEPGTAMADNI